MGKAVGGFFRLLVTLLILAVVGYNTWQVALLRAEVRQMKRERRSSSAAVIKESESLPSLLAAGQRHMERAREFLRINEYAQARRELAKATEALERQSRLARQEGAEAAAQTQAAIRSLKKQVETLWGHSASKESEKTRP